MIVDPTGGAIGGVDGSGFDSTRLAAMKEGGDDVFSTLDEVVRAHRAFAEKPNDASRKELDDAVARLVSARTRPLDAEQQELCEQLEDLA